ncbi:uncharacterized protein [Melanerpes formicivorus]|uniref:uncharacterized protein n=1 Tax=Melanerpes formicivorus TaxID=211600 RepID=UPI003590169B
MLSTPHPQLRPRSRQGLVTRRPVPGCRPSSLLRELSRRAAPSPPPPGRARAAAGRLARFLPPAGSRRSKHPTPSLAPAPIRPRKHAKRKQRRQPLCPLPRLVSPRKAENGQTRKVLLLLKPAEAFLFSFRACQAPEAQGCRSGSAGTPRFENTFPKARKLGTAAWTPGARHAGFGACPHPHPTRAAMRLTLPFGSFPSSSSSPEAASGGWCAAGWSRTPPLVQSHRQ